MKVAQQICNAIQAVKDSEGTKKRTDRRPIYVVTLSDEDKEFVNSVKYFQSPHVTLRPFKPPE